MKKKILVIDESALFLDYLTKKLEENGFEVVQGRNGLDGTAKMRAELPDLPESIVDPDELVAAIAGRRPA